MDRFLIYLEIQKIKSEKGWALQDIIRDLHATVLRIKISEDVKMFLTEKLAEIEYRLSYGASEKIQLSATVGCFQIAKEAISTKTDIKSLISHGTIATDA